MHAIELSELRYPRTATKELLSKAMGAGFDGSKIWFHGTRRRFDGFKLPRQRGIDELGPGVYLTSEKWLANTWARKGGFIVICVIRNGPLFDLADINSPKTMAVLKQGYRQHNDNQWSPPGSQVTDYDEVFDYMWRDNRYRAQLINSCLSGAGYVGGFKHNSQIAGQVVIFNPDDVTIIARQGGQAWMTTND
jgi:hypothetical protein